MTRCRIARNAATRYRKNASMPLVRVCVSDARSFGKQGSVTTVRNDFWEEAILVLLFAAFAYAVTYGFWQ